MFDGDFLKVYVNGLIFKNRITRVIVCSNKVQIIDYVLANVGIQSYNMITKKVTTKKTCKVEELRT
jgi:hypothetical protein